LRGLRQDRAARGSKNRPALTEFREFILRGNLVDLAVAVVIGTAFTAVRRWSRT
jgi:Large-conductance mechanosensitive channel, MscL